MKVFDGAGKGTQIKILADKLIEDGYKVKVYAFPEYDTVSGKLIAKYLQGEYDNVPKEFVSLAYGADRAKRSLEINQLLDQGYIVLCDRYTYSNMFSAAQLEKSKWDSFIEWVEDLEFNCLGVVKPDYNIYLHVDPEISFKRIAERGLRKYQEGKEDIFESDKQLLRNVTEAYKHFYKTKNNWIMVDEMIGNIQMSIESVSKMFYKSVTDIIKKHEK